MKFIDLTSEESTAETAELDRRYFPSDHLIQQVREILDQVRVGGDQALLQLVEKFDHTLLSRPELRVDQHEIGKAIENLDSGMRDALETAKQNVQEFARKSQRIDWLAKNGQGAEGGEYFHPFQRVGIYVPAGRASFLGGTLLSRPLDVPGRRPRSGGASPPGAPDKKYPPSPAAMHRGCT